MHEVPAGAEKSGKPRPPSPVEDEWIRGPDKAMIINVLQAGYSVVQFFYQFRRQILVEKNAHLLAASVGGLGHFRGKCVYGSEIFLL